MSNNCQIVQPSCLGKVSLREEFKMLKVSVTHLARFQVSDHNSCSSLLLGSQMIWPLVPNLAKVYLIVTLVSAIMFNS